MGQGVGIWDNCRVMMGALEETYRTGVQRWPGFTLQDGHGMGRCMEVEASPGESAAVWERKEAFGKSDQMSVGKERR